MIRRLRTGSKAPLAAAGILSMPLFFCALMAMSLAEERPTILAGDFNTFRIGGRPTWADLKRDAAALGLLAVSDKIRWTQKTLALKQILDEIFVASTHPIGAQFLWLAGSTFKSSWSVQPVYQAYGN